jgi:hypothetical protein
MLGINGGGGGYGSYTSYSGSAGQPRFTGEYDADSGRLALTLRSGSARILDWQAALRAVQFNSTSHNPSGSAAMSHRVLSFAVSDGAFVSSTVTKIVLVTPVNNPPELAGVSEVSLAFTEKGTALTVCPAISVADSDWFGDTNVVATVALSSPELAEDVLSVDLASSGLDKATVSVSYETSSGLLTIASQNQSLVAWQSILRNVQFICTSPDPAIGNRNVTIRLDDGNAANSRSNTVRRSIVVIAVNDAPVLSAIETQALTFTKMDREHIISAAILVSDVDFRSDTMLESAVVRVTRNATAVSTPDTLEFVSGSGIVSSYSAATTELTLSGHAPLSVYQTALRSVILKTSLAEFTGVTERTVTIRISDGQEWSSPVIRVVTFSSEPVPPQIVSAKFTNAGTAIQIAFDMPTDRAALRSTCPSSNGGICPAIVGMFDCSQVLAFPPARSWAPAKCTWASDAVLSVVLPADATVVPTDVLVLRSAAVKQQCTDTANGCSSWPYSLSYNLTVAGADAPLVLVPIITGPSQVGSCDGFSISAGLSSGGGGRRFSTAVWSVSSDAGLADAAAAAEIIAIQRATALASGKNLLAVVFNSSELSKGATYTFALTLSNFLGSSASTSLVVSKEGVPLPALTIPGNAQRALLRSEDLTLFADASAPACASASTLSMLSYSWLVAGGVPGGAVMAPMAISLAQNSARDPRKLRLNAAFMRTYLFPGGEYTVTAAVADSTGASNSAEIRVLVSASPLLAVIVGGDRSVGSNDAMVLNGTGSRDPDAGGVGTSPLTYSWTCAPMVLTASTIGSCGLDGIALNGPSLAVPANSLLPGRNYRFVLIVAADTRTATADVDVTVTEQSPPTVSITASLSGKVNPDAKLSLTATVLSRIGIIATWSLVSGNLVWGGGNDTSIFATPTTVTAVANMLTPVPLVLLPGTLSGIGPGYVFRLTATDVAGNVGFGTFAVTVNSPPSAGRLFVSPPVGAVLLDKFTLKAEDWVDEDLPFKFKFGYIVGVASSEAAELFLTGAAQDSDQYIALLPQGKGSNDTVTCVSYVYDSYGGAARATSEISVTPKQLSTEELASASAGLLAAAAASGDTEATFAALGAIGGLLPRDAVRSDAGDSAEAAELIVACSSAPNCTAFGRVACVVTTPGSCGACIPGLLSSTTTEQCMAPSGLCTNGVRDYTNGETGVDCGGPSCLACYVGSACLAGRDCITGRCVTDGNNISTCAGALAQCPIGVTGTTSLGECSGRGTCGHVDNSGEALPASVECTVADQAVGKCSAECTCNATWFGSDCAMAQAEHEAARALRGELMSALLDASDSMEADAGALAQQSSFVAMLTAEPAQLSATAQLQALDFVTTIALGAAGSTEPISPATASACGSTLSSLLDSSLLADSVAGETNATSAGATAGGVGAKVENALGSLSQAQLTGAVPGEAAAELSTKNVKMSSRRHSPSAFIGGGLSLAPPLSAAEKAVGVKAPAFALGAGVDLGGGAEVDAQVLSFKRNIFADLSTEKIGSAVVGLTFSAGGKKINVNASASSARRLQGSAGIRFVIANKITTDYAALPRTSNLTIDYQCKRGVPENKTIGACPLTGNVTIECNIPWWHNTSSVNRSVRCESKAVPTCDYWDEARKEWSGVGCVVVEFTPHNTTCECTHLTSFARKVGAIGGEAMAVLGSAANLFDPNELMKNLTVVLTFGIMFLLFVFALASACLKDAREKKAMQAESEAEIQADLSLKQGKANQIAAFMEIATGSLSKVGEQGMVSVANERGAVNDAELAVLELHIEDKDSESRGRPAPKTFQEKYHLHYNGLVQSILPLANGAMKAQTWLPHALQPKSCWSQFTSALASHHKWFSVAFLTDRYFTRPRRVTFLYSTVIAVFFTNAFLYDLKHPDNKALCDTHSSQFANAMALAMASPGGVANTSAHPALMTTLEAMRGDRASCESEASIDLYFFGGNAVCQWDVADEECFIAPAGLDWGTLILVGLMSGLCAAIPNGIIGFFFRRTSEQQPTAALAKIVDHLPLGKLIPMRRKEPLCAKALRLATCKSKEKAFRAQLLSVMAEKLAEAETAAGGTKAMGAAEEAAARAEKARAVVNKAQRRGSAELLTDLTAMAEMATQDAHAKARHRSVLFGEVGPRKVDRIKACLGFSSHAKARRRALAQLQAEERLEKQLYGMPEAVQSARLIELRWQASMSPYQKIMYKLNALKSGAPKPLPGKWCEALVWLFAITYLVFMGMFVVLFGLRKGESVSQSWLLTCLLSLGQQLLISGPLNVLFLNLLIPRYIVGPVVKRLQQVESSESKRGSLEVEKGENLRVRIATALRRDIAVRVTAATLLYQDQRLFDDFRHRVPGTELARRFGVRPNLWELADDKPIITEETGAEDEAKEIVEITELPPGRPTLPDDFETFDL